MKNEFHGNHAFLPLAGLLGLALLLTPFASRADMVAQDGTGRNVSIADTGRIVSIGGAVTEILYALGADKKIVGVDSTSLYPPRAMKDKPNVGYMRQLSAEGVLGLRPSADRGHCGLRSERDDGGAGSGEGAACGRARLLFRSRHRRKNQLDRDVRSAPTGRPACLTAHVHSDLAALAKVRRGIERAQARAVRPVFRQWARHGGRQKHRRRRHHQASRRRQRHRRI